MGEFIMFTRGFAVVAAMSLSAAAGAVVITIEGTEEPGYTPVSNQLGMSHGVVFSSLLPYCTFGQMANTVWGIYGTDPTANPLAGYAWYNSPIYMDFVDMSDGVTPATVSGTITGVFGDNGGDLDAIDIRVYDPANNLLQTATFSGIGFTAFSFTDSNIARLEVWPNTNVGSGTSDTFIDWISFPMPVPAPGAGLAMLIVGGALASRRKR